MEKQFIYSKTVAGRARYGGVFIDAVATPQANQTSELLVIYTDDTYQEAVKVGAEYFFDRYTATYSVDIIMQVHRIYEMPVDTSAVLITYGVVIALCEVFNFSIDEFYLDEKTLQLSIGL